MRQTPVSTPSQATPGRPGRGLRAACFGALLGLSVASQAAIVNGSFESTPDFTGWTTAGTTAIIGASSGGGGPIDGTRQAFLSTAPEGDALTTSTITQTFTGGGYVTFWWNFATNEFPASSDFNDFAFVVVDGVSHTLADTFSPLIDSTLGGFADMTGYRYAQIGIGTFGTHTITFGVSDRGADGFGDSALLIDNVQLIPEPAALSLVALGLGGVGLSRRRKPRG